MTPLVLALACFLWGFAEATVFFLIPDLVIGLAVLWDAEDWIWFRSQVVPSANKTRSIPSVP